MRRFGSQQQSAVFDAGPGARQVLFCFSHLRWDFVWQRPQHLLSRAANVYRTYFIEEPVFEESGSLRLAMTDRLGGVSVAVPVLNQGMSAAEQVEAQQRLVSDLVGRHAGDEVVLWYYTPMALAFSRALQPKLIVYDCMDHLSAFRGAPAELPALEEELLRRADLVFAGGRSLCEMKRAQRPDVHVFPSSIDAAHFAQARSRMAEPVDQETIPKPRLGFFGVIDERMDIDLLDQLAAARPEWGFVMIGPVVKISSDVLPRRPNIHWLGGKRYDDLPAYLSGWEIGIMPFALNESTRFISPTKTPEFLAAGVPVVSTSVADVISPYGELGLVEIAANAEAMAAKAEALMRRPKAPWLAQVDGFLANFSWDRTWADMRGLIDAATSRAVLESG